MRTKKLNDYLARQHNVANNNSSSDSFDIGIASEREIYFLLQQSVGGPILNDLLGLIGVIRQALDSDTDPQTRSMLRPLAEAAARELARRTAFWRAACGLHGRTTWQEVINLLDGRLARGRATAALEGIHQHEAVSEKSLPVYLLAAVLAGTALTKGGKVHIRRLSPTVIEFEPIGPNACYRTEVLGPLATGMLHDGAGTIAEIDDDAISMALAVRAMATMNKMYISIAAGSMLGGGSIRLHDAAAVGTVEDEPVAPRQASLQRNAQDRARADGRRAVIKADVDTYYGPRHGAAMRTSSGNPLGAAIASEREVFFLLQQGLGWPILNDLLGLSGAIRPALNSDADPQTRSMLRPPAEMASGELARRTAFWRAACGLHGRTTWQEAINLLDGRLARGRATAALEGIHPHEAVCEKSLPVYLLAAVLAGAALPKGGKVHVRRISPTVTEFEPIGPNACYRKEVMGPLATGMLPDGTGTIAEIDDDAISMALTLRAVAAMNKMGIVIATENMQGGGAIQLHHAAAAGTDEDEETAMFAEGRPAAPPHETALSDAAD